MSAAESEFVWVENPEDVVAPRADRRVEPDKRVESFAYETGHLEFRTARAGEFLNTDAPENLEEWR